ncbi:MAG: dTDP-glucose 4,6-dehydratase [Deltaproteobacteria bacterium RBG_13_60_28]|nr:MAG: dTDP-glucose 4,6-dehydratase [Deltaproteobacteria bacterium RBG_13_60_28]
MSTVLVTGGAGFIGANFVHYLRRQRPEWTIVNLDLLTYAGNPENLAALEGDPRHILVQGDVADRELVASLFSRYDLTRVVHFAAETHVDRSIMDPGVFVRTNVLGTFTLLEAARQAWQGLKGQEPRFLHISTDEVYGSLGPQDPAFTEETPYAPNSPYAASKAGADFLVRSYFHTYQFPALITNCSNNYGPYQFPEKLIPFALSQALAGKPVPIYGAGTNIRDWIYVEDHCRALLTVLEQGRPGETYNLGGLQEKPNLELVRLLLKLLREMRPELGHLEELITFVPDRPGHDWRYALSIAKIEEELGWRPQVDLEEGLRRTLSWYLSNPEWLERLRTGAYRDYLRRQYGGAVV